MNITVATYPCVRPSDGKALIGISNEYMYNVMQCTVAGLYSSHNGLNKLATLPLSLGKSYQLVVLHVRLTLRIVRTGRLLVVHNTTIPALNCSGDVTA
jgi:hypothetical protein